MYQVGHHRIGKVLGLHRLQTGVVPGEEVAGHRPEAFQGTAQAVEHPGHTGLAHQVGLFVHHPAAFLFHALPSTAAAEMREHFFPQFVSFQVGITPFHVVHQVGVLFQFAFQVFPCFGIGLGKGFHPQMTVLVYRRLGRGNARVKVDFAVKRKTVSLSIRRAEELYLFRNLKVVLVEDNIVLRSVSTATRRVLCGIFDACEAGSVKYFRCRPSTEGCTELRI